MKVSYHYFARRYKKIHSFLLAEMEHLAAAIDEEPNNESYLERFEEDFASLLGVKHAVGVHSGTSALQLGLLALGVRPGDEVIIPAHTYIATALAVSNIGAKPVLVDINPRTFNMDPKILAKAITPKTKAMLPVHMYGQIADMNLILQLAKVSNIKVIEDACQAFGASQDTKPAGTFGDAAALSFYTHKTLGGMGNGGLFITNDSRANEFVRRLRDPDSNMEMTLLSRRTPAFLDAIQIAFLNARMKIVDEELDRRREIALRYNAALNDLNIILPLCKEGNVHSYYSYVIRTNERGELRDFLLENNIRTEIEYLIPIHLTRTFRRLGYKKGDFPETEKIYNQMLSLPIDPYMTDEELDYVIKCIRRYFGQ